MKEISLDGGGGSSNKENDIGGNKSNRNSANLSGAEISPALMAQANWTFVEKLLKVCREKFVCCPAYVNKILVLGL